MTNCAITTATLLSLIAMPIAVTPAAAQLAFNPNAQVTPAQWIRNCVGNFEDDKAKNYRIFAMAGRRPPTHRENILYCVYGGVKPSTEAVKACMKAFEGVHKAEVDGSFVMLGERPPTHEENVRYCATFAP